MPCLVPRAISLAPSLSFPGAGEIRKSPQKQWLSLAASKRRKASCKDVFPANLSRAGHCAAAGASLLLHCSPHWAHFPGWAVVAKGMDPRVPACLPGLSCCFRHHIAILWKHTNPNSWVGDRHLVLVSQSPHAGTPESFCIWSRLSTPMLYKQDACCWYLVGVLFFFRSHIWLLLY